MKFALILLSVSLGVALYAVEAYPDLWERIGRMVAAFESTPTVPVAPPKVSIDPLQVVKGWTSITTRFGNVIPITKVTRVDAHSLHYQTDQGAGAVELADLPGDVRQSLGYDAVAAKNAVADEQAREAASDATVARVEAADAAQKDADAMANSSTSVTEEQYSSAQTDIAFASSHVVVDSSGYVSGDAYWVNRYWADTNCLRRHQDQIGVAARTGRTAEGAQTASNAQKPSAQQRAPVAASGQRPSPAQAPSRALIPPHPKPPVATTIGPG